MIISRPIIVEESARWAKAWSGEFGDDFQVSVNMSPVQFRLEDPVFAEAWLHHLRELELSGANIIVEITEGLLLNAHADVADKLYMFRDAGIQVAIDDFGTGYSTLSYLKRLHIDYLKIDQSFVRDLETDPNDMALSKAIIVMAHELGLKVIAEGVETAGQRELLAAAGCDYAQGDLYSKPLPPEEFEALLRGS
jgi:EAL domain-containing protein (putative c-di-GMP-specific phosphodiesterase class I)